MAFCHSSISISLPYLYCMWPNLPGLPLLYLYTASNQILEVGTAWEHSYRKFPNCLRPSVNKVTLTSSAWLKTECVDDNSEDKLIKGMGEDGVHSLLGTGSTEQEITALLSTTYVPETILLPHGHSPVQQGLWWCTEAHHLPVAPALLSLGYLLFFRLIITYRMTS